MGSRLMAARPDVSSTDLDSSHDAALPRSVTGGVLTDSGLMVGAQTVEIRFPFQQLLKHVRWLGR